MCLDSLTAVGFWCCIVDLEDLALLGSTLKMIVDGIICFIY